MFKPIFSNPLFESEIQKEQDDVHAASMSTMVLNDLPQIAIDKTQINYEQVQHVLSTPYAPIYADQESVFVELGPGQCMPPPVMGAVLPAASLGPVQLQIINIQPYLQSLNIPVPPAPLEIPGNQSRQRSNGIPIRASSSSKSNNSKMVDSSNPTLNPPHNRAPSKYSHPPLPITERRPRVQTSDRAAHSPRHNHKNSIHANDANTNKGGINYAASHEDVYNPSQTGNRHTIQIINCISRPYAPSNTIPQSEVYQTESSSHQGPKKPLLQTSKTISDLSLGVRKRPSTSVVSDDAGNARVEQELRSRTESLGGAVTNSRGRSAARIRSQAPISGRIHRGISKIGSPTKTKLAARIYAPIAQPGPQQPRKRKEPMANLRLKAVEWKNTLETASYLLASGKLTAENAVNAYQTLCAIDWYQTTYDTVWSPKILQETGLLERVRAVCGYDASGHKVDTDLVGRWDDRSRDLASTILERWECSYGENQPVERI